MEKLTDAMFSKMLEDRHGAEFVARMRKARVAVAGLGGLGSNVAVLLVRMGIYRLHLIDFDKVELSNLHRQQYRQQDIGCYKTQALSKYLLQINPFLRLKTDCLRLTEDNAASVLAEDEIICEALDAAEAKAMLISTILRKLPEKKIVAASGMAGIGSGNAIRTRKITGRLYLCGDEISDCENQPLTAARVALCAAHQAHIISRIILGLE